MFVPPVVLLVPLFLTVLDLPIIGTSLLNSYWAIWLPAGASAATEAARRREASAFRASFQGCDQSLTVRTGPPPCRPLVFRVRSHR